MRIATYLMQREHAPPGFWQWRDEVMPVAGVEIESGVPTRFFQTVDAYPRSWGRLTWRIQLNKIVDDRAGVPLFRSFYPGVEWNLNSFDRRWFLTAWFKWEQGDPRAASIARIEDDTVSFAIPPAGTACSDELYLRSRIDARDRHRVAETVARAREPDVPSHPELIVLDDFVDRDDESR